MPRLITFGGLSVVNGTVANGAANPRSRLAILAVIAAAGPRGIRREKLLAMFWPESDEMRARNALRQALFAMRRDLGGDELVLGTADLRLNDSVIASDVGQFLTAFSDRRFDEAASLYTGPFLDGVFIREAPEFDRWVDEQRRLLSDMYGRALEGMAAAAEDAGDRAAVAEAWRKRAAHDPLSARVAKSLMEALGRVGDVEAAIRHADVYAALVRSQLDAEPDPEIAALADRMRRRTPGPRAVSDGEASADEEPGEPAAEPTASAAAPGLPAEPRRRARLFAVAGFALAAGVIALAIHAIRPSNRATVLVTPFEIAGGDSSLASAGSVAASWISDGLAQTGLVNVIDLRVALERMGGRHAQALQVAADEHADMLVSGTVTRDGDSVRLDARIVRVGDGHVVEQLPPARFRDDASGAIDQLRQRVLGAFAAFGDDRFLPWANAMSTPPRYDAYQEYMAGLEAMARGDGGVTRHFMNAARLDTTFLQAKLNAVPDDGSERGYALADSLLRSAELQRSRYTPYDQMSLDEAEAQQRGNWEAAYYAARRLVDLAPASRNARMLLIQDAMGTMRYREAVDNYHLLNRNGWISEWEYFWRGELRAHHAAGDYDAELSESRRAFAAHPRSAGVCSLQIPPLAARGHVATLDSTVAYCSALPGAFPEFFAWTAGQELYAHGFRNDSRRVLQRLLANVAASGAHRPGVVAFASAYLGAWRPLFETTGTQLESDSTDFGAFGRHGAAAAHLGDTTTALAMEQHLAGLSLRGAHGQVELWRGFILAALGRRAQATDLIREAVEKGTSPTFFFHFNAAFIEPLRGYPPFEALTHR